LSANYYHHYIIITIIIIMAATTATHHHHHHQTLPNLNITTSFTSINMPSSSSCSSIGGASSLSSSSNHDDRRFAGHHHHNRKQGNNSHASPPPLLARAASAESSILLPLDFKPGPYTVICGRGRKVQESIGNRRLTVLAQLFIPQYAKATRKDEKSTIVSEIVRIVQEASQEPNRAFVRQASNNHDRWCQVDNLHAREKVGTVLRDLLSEKYRSSTKSKLVRRKERRQEQETKKSSSPSSSNPSSGTVPILMTPQPLPSMVDISLADFLHADSNSVL
jgi:hypothetical protein